MRKIFAANRVMDVARAAARAAGVYILSRKGKVRSLSYKGAINLVTDVDKTSEKIIVRAIKEQFPSHGILAEEAYSTAAPSEYRWIIDPLDGTTNFVHGLPIYSVSIALEHNGLIIAGAVYDPERIEMFSAYRGKGAYLNGKRIRVSSCGDLKKSLLVTGFAYELDKTMKNVRYFSAFLNHAQAVRRLGSAAIDMCYVACGRFDGFWEMDLKPWDTAAGCVITEEAGGKVTSFNGSKYSCYDKQLLTSNSKIHPAMIKVFSKNN